jgi:hypothetical protein
LAALLVLVLALRVVAAPVILSAPDPGLIAVCSGGEVYYVTLDGTPVDDQAPEGEPCPFHGVPLALVGVQAPGVMRPGRLAQAADWPGLSIQLQIRRARSNTARAPPLPV